MNKVDVVIIGAGAAGLMCAGKAAARGRKVVVLEKSKKIGEKIRISGGGRCNFTNMYADHDNYISGNPHFHKSALSRYSPYDFIALVEKHDIEFHEKNVHKDVQGQMFCDKSSSQIIDMLVVEVETNGGQIITECEVGAVSYKTGYHVNTNKGTFICDSIVVATGGLSIPKIGATDFGYTLAKQFDVKVLPVVPALVPLTLAGDELEFARGLSGISADAIVTCNGVTFRENILFTHRGLSGPAILQISSYWNKGDALVMNLIPELDLLTVLQEHQFGKVKPEQVLNNYFTKRFVQAFVDKHHYICALSEMKKPELEAIVQGLQEFTVHPNGSEGYAKAEVTRGGVDTAELSSKTMESQKQQGLFFIGEVVDVTGWLGGYNFQWAWASANAAAEHV
jgi:predicted Rossmann fold flavoprotein